MPQAEEVSQITDATERLSYVVKLTEAAANRTMDLVESATPVVNSLAASPGLSTDWGASCVAKSGLKSSASWRAGRQFPVAQQQDNRAVSSNLNDILLAQDYQDLTGQVIKRVTQLVTEVESNLLKLVLMASQVDRFAGIEHDREAMLAEKDPQKHLDSG
jgi:chemotaxis protein CheZ